MRQRMNLFLTLTLVAHSAAQAGIAANVNDTFNAWLIAGLKSARAKYSPDACLVAAYLRVTSAVRAQTCATFDCREQENYAMVYYDPKKVGSSYIFRSPVVLSKSDERIYTDAFPQAILGPIAETPSCIGKMPVSLLQAYRTAFATSLPLGKDDMLLAVLADFHDAHISSELSESSTSDYQTTLYCTLAPLHGLKWAFALIDQSGLVEHRPPKTLIVVDAERGTRVRVRPLAHCPGGLESLHSQHGAGPP